MWFRKKTAPEADPAPAPLTDAERKAKYEMFQLVTDGIARDTVHWPFEPHRMLELNKGCHEHIETTGWRRQPDGTTKLMPEHMGAQSMVAAATFSLLTDTGRFRLVLSYQRAHFSIYSSELNIDLFTVEGSLNQVASQLVAALPTLDGRVRDLGTLLARTLGDYSLNTR